MCMAGTTTIQIDADTKDGLALLKLHPRETWGDVVKRLTTMALDEKYETVKKTYRK